MSRRSIAYGSLREVETQTLIAARLRYLAQGTCKEVLNVAGEVGRLFNGLMASLENELCCPLATAYSGPSSAGTFSADDWELMMGGANKRSAYPSGNERTRPVASVTTCPVSPSAIT